MGSQREWASMMYMLVLYIFWTANVKVKDNNGLVEIMGLNAAQVSTLYLLDSYCQDTVQ